MFEPDCCMFNYSLLVDVIITMGAHARRFFVSQLEERFEESAIDVTILEVFQKLRADCPTQDQAQTVRSFVLGS